MKNGLLIVGFIALLWVVSANTANAAPANSSLDLSGIAAAYALTPDEQNRINALYAAMVQNGLTAQQCYFMLAQILFETGLLTPDANYRLMNQNNYAGLTVSGGGYAAYSSISDFITAYIGFLTKGANPLGATSLADFNSRLQQNGYYTEDPTVYYNGLLTYYNLLTQ